MHIHCFMPARLECFPTIFFWFGWLDDGTSGVERKFKENIIQFNFWALPHEIVITFMSLWASSRQFLFLSFLHSCLTFLNNKKICVAGKKMAMIMMMMMIQSYRSTFWEHFIFISTTHVTYILNFTGLSLFIPLVWLSRDILWLFIYDTRWERNCYCYWGGCIDEWSYGWWVSFFI